MPGKPQDGYVARGVDSEVVKAATDWNNPPRDRHAHWIHLRHEPDTGVHELLKHLPSRLAAEGFIPIYIDAGEQLNPSVPGPLAWSVFQYNSNGVFRRLKRAMGDFQSLSVRDKVVRALRFAGVALLLILYVEATLYFFSANRKGFADFWTRYLPGEWTIAPFRTLSQYVGLSGALGLGLTLWRALFPKPPRWNAKAAAEFADNEGYWKALREAGGKQPLALLIDNAAQLPPNETGVLHYLLETEEFIGVFISAGIPGGLRLGPIRQDKIDLPKLPGDILAAARVSDQRIRERVAAQWTRDEGQGTPGVIGAHEWTAFCAVLDRRSIGAGEMQRLYKEVVDSAVLPVLGFTGPQPAAAPETKLREDGEAREIFDEAFCRMEREEMAANRPELLAKVRFLLLIPGLEPATEGGHWREWPLERIRRLTMAAEHASDLANQMPAARIVDAILEGDKDARLALLTKAAELLLTAAEVHRVHGNLFQATIHAQAAAKWYGALEEVLSEVSRTSLFYQLWVCFWLSCEARDREEIRLLESDFPRVREHNVWEILSGYENYLARLPLWAEEPEDPGPGNPSLANIRTLAILRDELWREYGDDHDLAAGSTAFQLREYYEETAANSESLILLWLRQDILEKRRAGGQIPDEFGRRLAALRDRTELQWFGDRLLLDCQSLWVDFELLGSPTAGGENAAGYEKARAADDEKVRAAGDEKARAAGYEKARAAGYEKARAAGYERARAALKSRCEAVREAGLLLGFRLVVMRASFLLAWTLMAEQTEPAEDAAHLQRIVAAEPYLQEVLEVEQSLGWGVYAPRIYDKRYWEMSKLNVPSAVDEAAARYRAMQRAGIPPAMLRRYLTEACAAVTNYGTTADHYRLQGRLWEEDAALFEAYPDRTDWWREKTLEEQLVVTLIFAAAGWTKAGEVSEAERVLGRAREILERAEMERPNDDGIRQGWVGVLMESAALAQARGDRDDSVRALMESWAKARPGDFVAAFVFRALVGNEASAETLTEMGSAEIFAEQATNPYFLPDGARLAGHGGDLNRFEWRVLQLLSHAVTMRRANKQDFFNTVLYLGRVALHLDLAGDCRAGLLELLEEGEKYFRGESASTVDERQAIEIRRRLDPSPPSDLLRRVDEIEEKDRLLELREEELRNAIQHHNWLEEFLVLDQDRLVSEGNEAGAAYLADSRAALDEAKALLAAGGDDEAFQLLSGRVGKAQADRLSPADLVVFYHWIGVSPAQGRELLRRKLDKMVGDFVAQRFGPSRPDLAENLRQRFEALDQPRAKGGAGAASPAERRTAR